MIFENIYCTLEICSKILSQKNTINTKNSQKNAK